jgi:hypothetical protein
MKTITGAVILKKDLFTLYHTNIQDFLNCLTENRVLLEDATVVSSDAGIAE